MKQERICPACGLAGVQRIASTLSGAWGDYAYSCETARGGCGWELALDAYVDESSRAADRRHVRAVRTLQSASLRDSLAAVRAAEAELEAVGADVEVHRQTRRRISLGQYGVGSNRVSAIIGVSSTARQIRTWSTGAHAYRWYLPVAVVLRAAEILAAPSARAA